MQLSRVLDDWELSDAFPSVIFKTSHQLTPISLGQDDLIQSLISQISDEKIEQYLEQIAIILGFDSLDDLQRSNPFARSIKEAAIESLRRFTLCEDWVSKLTFLCNLADTPIEVGSMNPDQSDPLRFAVVGHKSWMADMIQNKRNIALALKSAGSHFQNLIQA